MCKNRYSSFTKILLWTWDETTVPKDNSRKPVSVLFLYLSKYFTYIFIIKTYFRILKATPEKGCNVSVPIETCVIFFNTRNSSSTYLSIGRCRWLECLFCSVRMMYIPVIKSSSPGYQSRFYLTCSRVASPTPTPTPTPPNWFLLFTLQVISLDHTLWHLRWWFTFESIWLFMVSFLEPGSTKAGDMRKTELAYL